MIPGLKNNWCDNWGRNSLLLDNSINRSMFELVGVLTVFAGSPIRFIALTKAKAMTSENEVQNFMKGLVKRNPHESEFHQAVEEVVASVMPWYREHSKYHSAQILERITEPDRIVIFRVSWETDSGEIRANRAWRVQFSKAIGPYKGGLRFHPNVSQSVLKFLGFEQIFKNSLTGLPMGGAKGGSNFNPKGKSNSEIMRFCQSMMSELHRHIGEDVDIPAGDIGVGGREISFLFGQYMRLQNRWSGVMTGKGSAFGGSAVRTEATGYGCVYFCQNMMNHHDLDMKDKRVVISGSGNVARYAAEKAMDVGAKVLTLSDSDGFVFIKNGMTPEQLQFAHQLKEERYGRISDMADEFDGVEFHADSAPWGVECEIALPCATQNELDGEAAKQLVDNGVVAVCEGANMPTTADAMKTFRNSNVLHAPGKASNAGGVAVSGLEQSQNAMRMQWSHEEVDTKLKTIMKEIHQRCEEYGKQEPAGPHGKKVDYIDGANVASFQKVADALLGYGVF